MPRGKRKTNESQVLSVARAIAGLTASERELALEFSGVLLKKAPEPTAEEGGAWAEVNVGATIRKATRHGRKVGRKVKARAQQAPEAKPVSGLAAALGKGKKLAAAGAE